MTGKVRQGMLESFCKNVSGWLSVTRNCGEGLRIKTNVVVFITLFSLVNSLLFHRSMFEYATNNLEYSSLNGALTLLTLYALVIFTTASFLALVALFLQGWVKPVSMLILFGNSIALYFAEAYHVVFDRTMMGNVFHTNPQEAGELFHPRLLVYIFVYAILPYLLLLRVQLQKIQLRKRSVFLLVLLLLFSGWSFANAKTWLWVDKHASKLGGMIMPWSYVINSIRWYQGDYLRNSRQEILLPDAHFIGTGKAIVVLVIGEAARAQNFSLYGYQRPTNPLLARDDVVVLPDATACATYTTASIECMLSHLGSGTGMITLYEPLPSYLQRNGVNVIWRTDNWGEPRLKINLYERADSIRGKCNGEGCNYDEALLTGLESELKGSVHDKTFVVLHQHGSHGPSYFKNYPGSFERFKPVCNSVDLQKCSSESLVNAYDNTILYTDHFLDKVISLLKSFHEPTVMLYVSDHGESLGEYGLYLHGTPYSIAPDVQKKVPFIVWMSDEFKRQRGIRELGAIGVQYSDDNVFHSVMGALDMRSDIYKKQQDIFNVD